MEAHVRVDSIIIFLALFLKMVSGDCPAGRDEPELHDEGRLHQDLLCAYRSDYRPVKSHTTSVQVKVRFSIKYITFDFLEQTFTVHSWVALSWKDEFLSWKPSDYGDIKEIQMESMSVWTPRMSLFNADVSLSYQDDRLYTTCLVSSDGTVTCVPHLAHSGICRTMLGSWPYDTQNCTLYFGSWMHTGEQVNFTFYKQQAVVLDDYKNGPGWKLLKVVHDRLPGKYSSLPNSTYPILKYTFIMKREAAGPAALVIVPSVVIVLLTLTSLLLEVKDNVRLLLACFSLFGHFMFISEIGYDIPRHSNDTPVILLFIRDSMVLTLVAILETLFLMALRKRTVPAPAWVVSVTRLVHSGPGKYAVFTEFDPNDVSDKKDLTDEGASTAEDKSRIASEWIQFAGVLNSFLFIISFLTYLVLIVVYIPSNRE